MRGVYVLGFSVTGVGSPFGVVGRLAGERLDDWCHDKSRDHQNQALGVLKHHGRVSG